ncbi:MAG: glycosyltransferase family 4 protein [Flavobacteriaceae bacterium]|nr:glycosyltransferase family 4 protein [Flavobacteriaceae bacterium]
MDSLIKNRDCFDTILSPSRATSKNIYCEKRKFITYHKWFRKMILFSWVARDYLKTLGRLAVKTNRITVLIMDDPHLAEAIALKKSTFAADLRIIFSFHGYRLKLRQEVVDQIDKVIFLSEKGKNTSIESYKHFKPETAVVWNGVNSSLFFPLEDVKRDSLRTEMGFNDEHLVLIWMANDRPLKGFHIFRDLVQHVLQKFNFIKVITIGTTQKIDHPTVLNVGRIPNSEIPKYLQAGDIYLFTSLYEEGFGLSMIEALKCGNTVIASNRGAIPDVLDGLPDCHLVDDPESVSEWIEVTKKVIEGFEGNRLTAPQAHSIWNYSDWETRYMSAIV